MILGKLREKIKRYAALTTGDFETIFENFRVPSLPDIVVKLLTLLRDPEASAPEVASLLSYDPGLASQILQMVNSAHIGLRSPVSNLSQAVNILGLKQIETLVVSYGVTKIVKDPKRPGFDLSAFWTDSLFRALFSHQLGKKFGREDETFLGALLQDIALPVLLTEWYDAYQKAYLVAQEEKVRLSEAETKILNWHHAQAGAWLAKKWHLSEVIICAIGLHISAPEELSKLPLEDEVFPIVAASAALPSVLEEEPSWKPWETFLDAGFFSVKEAKEAFSQAREHLLETAKNFGLKVREPLNPPNL
ncbi:MAG: HDOD domain-containing protein [Thermodesulfobacteria bacterium]|nr:HDOD domain-containing protein [Thermodesulfobacteriota bacterium]